MSLFAPKFTVAPTPRKHQVPGFKDVEEFFNGNNRKDIGLYIAPVAYGKSYLVGFAAHVANGPTLVIQPNGELLTQNYGKLIEFGGQGTIYSDSAGQKVVSEMMFVTPLSLKVLISEDRHKDPTVEKNRQKFRSINWRNIIIDEADYGIPVDPNSVFMKIFKFCEPKKVLGLTASPVRLKRNSEGARLVFLTRERPKFWKRVVGVCQIQDMIEYWSPLIYHKFSFDSAKLKLNKDGSEFTDKSIKIAVQANSVNERIEKRIRQLMAEGRKSILVYVDSIENAKKFENLFPGQCHSVSANTPKTLRRKLVAKFKNLEFPIMTNVRCFSMGFDHPLLDAIILGYPTFSWRLYYQMLGRGVRIYKEDIGKPIEERVKPDCLITDYCDNITRFGAIENITIEEVENYGWGVFQNQELITGFPMSRKRKTMKELIFTFNPHYKEIKKRINYGFIHFGTTHRGKSISDCPTEFLEFMVYRSDRFGWDRMMGKFEEAAKLELHTRKALQN